MVDTPSVVTGKDGIATNRNIAAAMLAGRLAVRQAGLFGTAGTFVYTWET